MGKEKIKKMLFVAFILICVFFRLSRILSDSLSQDEFHVLQVIERQDFFNIDLHPPFYFMVLYAWTRAFGTSDFSMRFPSLIFELTSVAIIYAIGEKFIKKDSGRYAAMISLMSGFFIFHSSDAKSYSLYLLLSLLSTYFFLSILRKMDRRDMAYYVISSTLLIYTHYHGFFILFSHAAYLGILFFIGKGSRSAKAIFMLQGVSLALFAPFILSFISQAAHMYTTDPYGHLYLLESLVYMLHDWTNFLPLFATLLMISGCAILIWKGWDSKLKLHLVFLSAWIIVPLISCYIISVLFADIFRMSRFFIGIVPAYYLFLSLGAISLKDRKIKALIILSVIASCLLFDVYFVRSEFKTPWKTISGDLAKHDQVKHNVLVLDFDYMKESFARYYKGDNLVFMLDYAGKDFRIDPLRWGSPCDVDLIHADADLAKIDFSKPLFFVYNNHPDYNLCNDAYMGMLKERYSKVSLLQEYCTQGQMISGWSCNNIRVFEFSDKI